MKSTTEKIASFFPLIGVISLIAGGIAYFITRRWDLATNGLLGAGAILFLLYAILQPDDVRQKLSGRQAKYGTSTVLSVLFFLLIAIMLYYVSYQNEDWRYDSTETGEFTPLPQTIELIQNLDEPVHVIGFYTFDVAADQEQAQAALDSLKAYSDKFTYEFQDPNENPLLAQKYELNFNGTLVFTKGEGDKQVFSKSSTATDRDIYLALVKVVNPVHKKLYFVTGHGERDPEDFGLDGLGTAKQFNTDAGFEIAPLNLFTTGSVPDDATVVAIVDQQVPMTDDEVKAIQDYLNRGGSVFLARDVIDGDARQRVETDGINALLQTDWGITLRDDIIIDQTLSQAGQTFGINFLGADYGNSPITRDLKQYGTAFYAARSLVTEDRAGISKINLITTSDQAWGETDFQALSQGSAQPDAGADADGVLNVGVSAENSATGGRLVVFGDTDFLSNRLITLGGNNLLFSGALNWLANDEVSIDLAPRDTVQRQVLIPQTQLGFLQMTSLCLSPVLMMILGIGVWYSRRKTR